MDATAARIQKEHAARLAAEVERYRRYAQRAKDRRDVVLEEKWTKLREQGLRELEELQREAVAGTR